MNTKETNFIYIFSGEGSHFPSGVFTSFKEANNWIMSKKLTGCLNELPINIPLYDWAIQEDFFKPSKEYQKESKFIQNFTCASIDHWHFEEGYCEALVG